MSLSLLQHDSFDLTNRLVLPLYTWFMFGYLVWYILNLFIEVYASQPSHKVTNDRIDLESHDVRVRMPFSTANMTSLLALINWHGVCAVSAVCCAVLQKWNNNNLVLVSNVDGKTKNNNDSGKKLSYSQWKWNHKIIGYVCMILTLCFSGMGLKGSLSNIKWTHFQWFAFWFLYVPWPLAIIPVIWTIYIRRNLIWHRYWSNVLVKMLVLSPLSRVLITVAQRMEWAQNMSASMLGIRLMDSGDEWNYYVAILLMTAVNVPWQIHDTVYTLRYAYKQSHSD